MRMALVYSSSSLKSISSKLRTICCSLLWRRLSDFGISKVKPTRRGCRGGSRRRQACFSQIRQTNEPCSSSGPISTSSTNAFTASPTPFREPHLHTTHSTTITIGKQYKFLNTQSTLDVNNTYPSITKGSCPANLINIGITGNHSTYNFPRILLSNTRSMVNKLDEINCVISSNQCDIAVITKSWLSSNISNDLIRIPGYSSIRRDRPNDQRGGGLCTFIKA